mmetsp:Transcript_18415/g.34401  ORF Transcript_18415/g.34401 Transcript_18415/m.34401 type:complete len:354 (+) Transcript_18415:78-1139(+)
MRGGGDIYNTPPTKVHRTSRTLRQYISFTKKYVVDATHSGDTDEPASPLSDARNLSRGGSSRYHLVHVRRQLSAADKEVSTRYSPTGKDAEPSRTGQSDSIKLSKNRVKQLLKRVFHRHLKSRRQRRMSSPHPRGPRRRQGTPFRKKRGAEFHCDNLRAKFNDVVALELKLYDGLRIQMTTVASDVTLNERTVFYDNWISKLHVEGTVCSLEMWKPATGEVIPNLFDVVDEIVFDEKVGLVYASRVGSGDDVVLKYGDASSSHLLFILLSLCYLRNTGEQPARDGEALVRDDFTVKRCRADKTSTSEQVVISSHSKNNAYFTSCLATYSGIVLGVLLLSSLLRGYMADMPLML